jgi:hypothetical protein
MELCQCHVMGLCRVLKYQEDFVALTKSLRPVGSLDCCFCRCSNLEDSDDEPVPLSTAHEGRATHDGHGIFK